MSSGWVSAAISSTHSFRRGWLELAWCVGAIWAIGFQLLLRVRWVIKPTRATAHMTRWWPKYRSDKYLFDVRFGRPAGAGNLCGVTPRHQHQALELSHQDAILVQYPCVHPDRSAVRL